jgi:hypothetical protein
MPQTYYAVTTPIKSGTIKTVKSSEFQNTFADERTLIRYKYNDLILIINKDPNIKLFVSEALAKANASEIEAIDEDKEKEANGFIDLALSVIVPAYGVLLVTDALLPAQKVRNLYQSMILKITVRDENSILPDDSNTAGCVGVLPPRRFNVVAHEDTYARSISFSISNSCYLHTLRFRKDHNYSVPLSSDYPQKYRETGDDLNTTTALLKDYDTLSISGKLLTCL